MRRMAFPERLLTEGEVVITEFRPHWRLVFLPLLWVLLGIVAIWLIFTWIPPDDNMTIDLALSGLILIALIPLAVVEFVRWWFTLYVLTNERLITRRGVVARSGIEIPLENITNVHFEQSMIERFLRSGDLLIESAGTMGQSRFEDIPEPDEFQALLYKTREDRSKALGSSMGEGAPDFTLQLERLSKLHREGVLTDEEFEAKKRALLDQP